MKTQALGWLTAAVLAAGLNASYHDGGMQWAHRAVDQVEHSSAAVLALASGHVGQFLAEAQLVANHVEMDQQTERQETRSCRWATAMARAQAKLARTESSMTHFEAMSARQQAQLARFEANRDRFEARMEAQTAHLRTITMNPAVMESIEIPSRCQRIHIDVPRVTVPRVPTVQIQAPVIHLDLPGDPI